MPSTGCQGAPDEGRRPEEAKPPRGIFHAHALKMRAAGPKRPNRRAVSSTRTR